MLAEKNICTGCGACAASCPVNCIEMLADQEGFRYPVIDATLCVSCHKCETVCPVPNTALSQVALQAYAAKNKDDTVRRASSSGGIFPALATFILDNGGAVCGATYTTCFEVEHTIIEDALDIKKLQGAKYAQSNVTHLFKDVKCILESGKWLLFVGTPCQVAGIRTYLGKDYSNLILVDMICHGVPSPLAWLRYLDYRVKKDTKNGKIIRVNQRDKVSGWSRYQYSLRIDYIDGQAYCVPQSDDSFMRGFVNNLFLRPSCGQCQFKGSNRCSDITIGDYWGIWEQHPEFDDNMGVSLVIVNTEKGTQFWNMLQGNLIVIPVSIQEALTNNPSAFCSSKPHPKRSEFFDCVQSSDFEKLVSKLLFPNSKNSKSIRNLLRKIIKL